jgi:type IV pilus assembly protein PilQ
VENPNKLVQGSRGGYQGEKLSLNFQNIDVRAVLQVIADFTNFNIITSDSVGGTLTLRLKDVPWDQALDIILQTKGLDMRKNGNVIRIAPRGELAAEEKANLESMQQITDLEPTRSESFQVNYQKAEDVQKVLSNKEQPVLSKRGSVMADLYTNRLFVTDTPSRLNEVRNLLALIDKPAKQVMVEAKIIQADEKFDQEVGVRLGLFDMKGTRVTGGRQGIGMTGGTISPDAVAAGAPQTYTRTTNALGSAYSSFTQASTMGQVSFSLFSSSLSRILNVELQAMESDGRGKKLSNPRVVTANNVKAIIEDGTEIPYTVTTANTVTTQFKKAKLALEVTPQITPDGRVKMKLMITKDRPDFANAVNGIPAIASSKVETDVLVENGGTVVIGGVSSTDDTETLDRIPVLGDIPYVGFLFKHRQTKRTRNELLIFITPKILDDTLSMR